MNFFKKVTHVLELMRWHILYVIFWYIVASAALHLNQISLVKFALVFVGTYTAISFGYILNFFSDIEDNPSAIPVVPNAVPT